MKFTINECIQRINQILNYPAVSYVDISHFFDHAISELNSILRIGLPSVSELLADNTYDITLQNNTVLLEQRPTYSSAIPSFMTIPTDPPSEEAPAVFGYYAPNGTTVGAKYFVWNGVAWVSHNVIYGVNFNNGTKTAYIATPIANAAYWVETSAVRTQEFDLCEIMPLDWWILFVIPYVCFKFAVRNGDDGALYATEFTEGLQQLQTCYDVPNFVDLNSVAGDPAYTKIVQNNLNNLGIDVPTRAIKETMRVGNAIRPIYENVYDTGGWGV